jgi:peptidoglycan/LPS O-acetylase OafA/YrhL
VIREQALSRKNNDIEILRAFAILYTVVLHFRVLLPAESPSVRLLEYLDLSVGVDLFLVISGFVITGSVMDSASRAGASRRALMFGFWIKRIYRLLPAAWTWVAIACLAQLAIIATTDIGYQLRDVFTSAAAALANVMNVYTPHCIASRGVQTCFAMPNFVGHYWSLSLEEQFYLVFPLLFFFLPRRALVALLVAAIAVQFLWQRPFFTYAWYFKTDALCWGILLSLVSRSALYQQHVPGLVNMRRVGPLAGLALLAALPLVAANIQGIGPNMKTYGVAVVALICAAIVWLASYDRDIFAIGGRYRRLMLYFGSRSYSLYLSHLVVYLCVRDLFDHFGGNLAATLGPVLYYGLILALALGLAMLGAELCYRKVESVMRPRGREIAARMLARSERSKAPGTGADNNTTRAKLS